MLKKQHRRLRRWQDFPRHRIGQFACSPCLDSCIPIERLHYDTCIFFLDEIANGKSRAQAAVNTFMKVYDCGWIWYPRDRWRTAWALMTSACGLPKQALSTREIFDAIKVLRNPSSPYEELK